MSLDKTGQTEVSQAPDARRAYVPLLLFAGVSLALLLIGYSTFQVLRDDGRAAAEASLKAVGELKIGQLQQWVAERRGDAGFMANGSRMVSAFDAWLQSGGADPLALAQLRRRMADLEEHYGYNGIILYDAQGEGRLNSDEGGVKALHQDQARLAIAERKICMVDFHRHDGADVALGFIAPLWLQKNGTKSVIGAIYLNMPAERLLFPLLRLWPLPTSSGETVLARQEGDEILFILSAKAPLLTEREPIDNPDLPTARLLHGERGILRHARDYVGDPVLAYVDRVPDTPWLLVAKQDQIEVDRPINQLALELSGLILLLLMAAAVTIRFWWRAEQDRYHNLILNEQLQRALVAQQGREALQASEEKYRILADYSADWEYWVGADDRFLYVSPACEAICGYPASAFYAEAELMTRIIHPEDRGAWRRHLGERFEPDHPHAPLKFRIHTPAGELRWIEHVCTPVQDAAGRYQGQRGSNRNITDRQRAEEELRQSRGQLLAIFESLDEVIYVADPQTYELLYVNPYFEKHWGKVDLGSKCHQVLQGRDSPCPFCTNDKIFGDHLGETFVWEFRNQVTQRWYRCADKAIRWADGRLVRFELASDITEKKLAEIERASYQKRLESAVKRRTAELETANQDLEGFSYSVSHDLRSPLRAIDGFIAILQEDYGAQLDAEAGRLFGVVQDNARKMGELIDDILAFSRAGRLELQPMPIDMMALVTEVWDGLAREREGLDCRLQLDELPKAWGDAHALRQVWRNLLGNAIKFSRTRQPPLIQVGGRRDDQQLHYWVRDNGVGFNADYRDKLFVLFQRLHGMDEFEGTGVGLAIVKRFVRKHGGRVQAEARPGEGATFGFTLPLPPQAGADDGDKPS